METSPSGSREDAPRGRRAGQKASLPLLELDGGRKAGPEMVNP